ncbi:thioredoxin [Nocardia donostiensis]|uniref:Thioredoxin n=1 Tax=Nocardia donostiensis TaxID=1538463 RepID=A0A1W0AUC4_9NOCA|nr:thioredoxin [Nocardia donostiensis]ONM48180.1 thioredoxin [Nocardia donostiensis]OQS13828.1 thioredoxin [Nocardia donostiensis]OQS17704.1 thioredoxin [Nocardia donostiensis]
MIDPTSDKTEAENTMANTINVSDETFERDVLSSRGTVVVAFWAPWCGPCRMFAPILDETAGDYRDQITVARMNIDENPQSMAKYQVMGVPTTIVFRAGEPVHQFVGAMHKRALVNELGPYLPAATS